MRLSNGWTHYKNKKTSTVDTVKETTKIGSILGKIYIKRSISITTNCVNTSVSKIFHYRTTCPKNVRYNKRYTLLISFSSISLNGSQNLKLQNFEILFRQLCQLASDNAFVFGWPNCMHDYIIACVIHKLCTLK